MMDEETREDEEKRIKNLTLKLKDEVTEFLKEEDKNYFTLKNKYEKCLEQKCKKLDIITNKVDNNDIIKLDDKLDFVKEFEMETNAYLVKKSILKDHRKTIEDYNKCVELCMTPLKKRQEYLDLQLRSFQMLLNDCFYRCKFKIEDTLGDCTANCLINYSQFVLPNVRDALARQYAKLEF